MVRRIALVVALCAAPVVGSIAAAQPVNADTVAPGHCKDAAHLAVRSPEGNSTLLTASDVDVVEEQVTDQNECFNDTSYRGAIYVFVVHGQDGLRMYLDGPAFVMAQFRANSPNPVELQHTRHNPKTGKVEYTDYAEFTNGARAHIVGELHDLGF